MLNNLFPPLSESVEEPDELALFAKKEKTLTTGAKIKHVSSNLPRKVEGEFFWDWKGKKHRIVDFEWEEGRFLI